MREINSSLQNLIYIQNIICLNCPNFIKCERVSEKESLFIEIYESLNDIGIAMIMSAIDKEALAIKKVYMQNLNYIAIDKLVDELMFLDDYIDFQKGNNGGS